ncbi:uncharacterized protein PV09_06152 [Verruconis gallopava]|uniref:Fork-head domain-containing protein n=1 Tax=Verruconis gallopava TaxID=253628 RepID=A0A0D2A7I6_9PEZI|nr:uncharacterized protein PV09_06152 [Verruconis gallopava]KIW02718.1 hypothetical protein PV09_06152 [Verruconis gallopava]
MEEAANAIPLSDQVAPDASAAVADDGALVAATREKLEPMAAAPKVHNDEQARVNGGTQEFAHEGRATGSDQKAQDTIGDIPHDIKPEITEATRLQQPADQDVVVRTGDGNAIPASDRVDVLQHHAEQLSIKSELPVGAELPVASLAPPFSMDAEMAPLDSLPYTSDGLLDQYTEQPIPVQPATGFAKLEFQDGHFYMTTYAVELGRDMRAYKMAQQYQARMQLREERSGKRSQRSTSLPGTPVRPIRNDTAGMSARSFLSESGGIVGDDDGHIKLKRRKKKKSSKSKSTDTSSSRSQSMSRKNSINQVQPKFDYNQAALQTVDPNVTAPLDPMVHMPDPHFTPLIPVHPPMNGEDEFSTGKGISRKHIRIAYNFDRCHFEMIVYGRNGAFHDDQHYPAGSTVPLHDGSVIQIGGVSLRFVLPTVALETADPGENDFDSVSGRMSFNFEDGRGESIIADEDELDEFSSPSARARAHAEDYEDYGYEDFLDEEEEGDIAEEEDEEEEDEYSSEEDTPKKRGPGRPKTYDRKSLPKAKDKRSSKTVANQSRKGPKLTLKISAKDKARQERAKLKAEAEARERERAEAKAKAAKIKAKEAAKAKAKAQAEAEAKEREKAKKAKEAEARAKESNKEPFKEATKEAAKETSKETSKETTKETSKAPTGEPPAPKEPSAPRIARDAPLQNGEDINVPGLPAGIIIPARKKGPGRPPKDGVMSKRERAQLIKQAKEREKAIKLGLDPSTIPPPEIRPPKPKPRRNSKGEEVEGDGDDDEKRPKIPRPPRSPSPEMRIEDYTEEQLQRPSANYVYLIYEAIKNSKAGVMNLQQIYSAIERKYPWYKFKAGSNGWQSSVRHNLGQHEAFKKVEKEGKGWLWGIKEGVPIERERKKKSPPPQPPPHYGQGYPYPQYGNHQYPPYPPGQYQQRPPGAPMPPNMTQQGRPPGQVPPNGYPPHVHAGSQPHSANGQHRPPYPPHGRPPYPAHAQQLPPQQFKRYKPPSAEVIDTFKKVFISTYASRNDNNTAKAESIVTNAIKRVLEPETMIGVPKDTQEENVMRAFEGILVQSQGPPRQLTPSQAPANATHQQGQFPPRAPPSNAAAHQGSTQRQDTQGQSVQSQQPQPQAAQMAQIPPQHQPPSAPASSVQAPPSVAASSPSGNTSVPSIPPAAAASAASQAATAPPPSQAGATSENKQAQALASPKPQGPAEANLLGMLMGGPNFRSGTNTPVPRSTSPTGPPPEGISKDPVQRQNHSVAASQATVPPQPASTTQTLTQKTTSTPASAPTSEGLGLNINTSLPKDTILERPNGIPRTMTPTRPAVEPLTPPVVASPKVNNNASPNLSAVASNVPTKRARSPEVEGAADEHEGEVKKVKIDP